MSAFNGSGNAYRFTSSFLDASYGRMQTKFCSHVRHTAIVTKLTANDAKLMLETTTHSKWLLTCSNVRLIRLVFITVHIKMPQRFVARVLSVETRSLCSASISLDCSPRSFLNADGGIVHFNISIAYNISRPDLLNWAISCWKDDFNTRVWRAFRWSWTMKKNTSL